MIYEVDLFLKSEKVITTQLEEFADGGCVRRFFYYPSTSAPQDQKKYREAFRDYIFESFKVITLEHHTENEDDIDIYTEACNTEKYKEWFFTVRKLLYNGQFDLQLTNRVEFEKKLEEIQSDPKNWE